jgi:hypothetical protein
MSSRPDAEFTALTANERLLDIEERIEAQELRIASLEVRMKRQDPAAIDQAIASLKESMGPIIEEGAVRKRNQAELASRVGLLEESQAQREKYMRLNRPPEGGPRDCLEHEVAQLKRDLIEMAVLPEFFSVPTRNRFDGIISRLTRECGGNVADGGIVAITASSFLNDTYLPRNAADIADISNMFSSKGQSNEWIE